MSGIDRVDPGLPVGPTVEGSPAAAPGPEPLAGRWVSLAPPSGSLAEALYPATHGSPEAEAVWTYMPYGPFHDEGAMAEWLDRLAGSADPRFFAVTLDGIPVGVVSYLNAVTTDRRIEIGHIWYAPAAQRTRANTEVAYLLLRRAFEELGNRRVEWKCDALNARSRAAAGTARLHLRGDLPAAHDREGPQPRHGVVLDARSGMAGGARRDGALARGRARRHVAGDAHVRLTRAVRPRCARRPRYRGRHVGRHADRGREVVRNVARAARRGPRGARRRPDRDRGSQRRGQVDDPEDHRRRGGRHGRRGRAAQGPRHRLPRTEPRRRRADARADRPGGAPGRRRARRRDARRRGGAGASRGRRGPRPDESRARPPAGPARSLGGGGRRRVSRARRGASSPRSGSTTTISSSRPACSRAASASSSRSPPA